MLELTVRLVFSLSVVLGLLILCIRVAGRRFQGRRDALVQVVHRQPLGRHASVSVVNVGGRVLVLGTTDQEVRLLTELDPLDLVEEHDDDRLLTLVPDEADDLDLGTLLEEPAARPGRHVAPRGGARVQTRGHSRGQTRARSRAQHPAQPADGRPSPFGGSVLSVRTWRQAWGAVTGHAS